MRLLSSLNGIITLSVFIIAVSSAFCQYQEGIDTTDTNGYCRDSLFWIVQNTIVSDSSSKILRYGSPYFEQAGYFNHAFDDIQKTPDTFNTFKTTFSYLTMNLCYAIRRGDNSYAKICLLQKLANGSYIYRYARNTDNKLVPQSNNLFKPNNLFYKETYTMPSTSIFLTWETTIEDHVSPSRIYSVYFQEGDGYRHFQTHHNCAVGFPCFYNRHFFIDSQPRVGVLQSCNGL